MTKQHTSYRPWRMALTLLIATTLVGCGGAGSLLSNPRVSDADNNQVVAIGDSIFALSGKLQDYLEDYAGETFRRYTLSGAQLSGGILATSVVDQYDVAKADNPDIKTVLMDGGGNDILLPVFTFDPYGCRTQWYKFGKLSQKCKSFIDDIYVVGVDLMNDMHADGVENVVYLGYYHTKNALLPMANLKEAVNYGDEKLALACSNSAVRCSFVDPRATIKNSDIIIDGIHPASSGSRKLADLVWPKLQPLL